MKKLFLLLLILNGMTMNSFTAIAQIRPESATLLQAEDLASGLTSILNSTGTPIADVAWPGYRLMDANGVLRVLADVMGNVEPDMNFSTPSYLLWSDTGSYRLQTRYADFGGTCDLNNPQAYTGEANVVTLAPKNDGNSASNYQYFQYQQGTYSTCDSNSHFSRNQFAPTPLMTRAAWMYRACQKLSLKSQAKSIALMVERIRKPDPVSQPVQVGTIQIAEVGIKLGPGNTPLPPPPYNWCQNITPPSESDLQALFRTFYNGRQIPQKYPSIDSSSLKTQSTDSSQRLIIPISYTPADQYKEKLIEVINASNQFIDLLSNSAAINLELGCTYPVMSNTFPTRDQIKALNAWRAVFMTMCTDPGWQVL